MVRQRGVGGQQGLGLLLGHVEGAGVLHKVCHAQGGQAVLRLPEKVAGAAGLQIIFGHLEPVGGAAEKVQALAHRIVLVIGNEDTAGIRRTAPHPPAQLVQGGQAEPFGVFDDHDGGVGHIHPHLDDGGGHQHIQRSCLEFHHHIVFFFGFHLAVEQPHPPSGQQRAGGLGVILFDRLHARVHLVFFDGRADDVYLMPRGDLFFQKAVHVPPFFAGDEPCLDGLAAGGQLVQNRDVQIPVHEQPQGAGNGGGGHDQQVRALRLACQQAPLAHPEAMLLVHDGKPQIFELHRVGEHRVGAHHQPGAAIRDGGQRHPALGGFHAAHQQRHVDAERLQTVGQRGGMLPGQNFGGGQHGALPAVLGGVPDGRRRHQRFAAAHIPLQQAVHGRLAAQVAGDFLRRALLRSGGGIGQAAPEGPQIQRPHGGTGLAAAMAAQQEYSNL